MTVSGGGITVKSGDDGLHADNTLTIEDGTIVVEESCEGLEAIDLTINGGTIDVTASDDGLNAAAAPLTAALAPRVQIRSPSTAARSP